MYVKWHIDMEMCKMYVYVSDCQQMVNEIISG